MKTKLEFGSKELVKIIDILNKNQANPRIIGGAVRDSLLGAGCSDIDIATILLPEEIIKIFEIEGYKAIPTGIDHGTITIVAGLEKFEITTLRKDIAPDGRRSVVEYTKSYEIDASRRDFTINALSYDFTEEKLYDYFGGLDDIKNNIVRFIGSPDQRIKEDYLRILRFFRFSARFSNIFDHESLNASIRNLDGLSKISVERINSELKLLCKLEKDLSYIFKIFMQAKLFQHFLPEFDIDYEGILNFEAKINEITEIKPDLVMLRFSVLGFSLGRREFEGFFKSMKFSSKETRIALIIYDFIKALIDLQKIPEIYSTICKFWYYNPTLYKEILSLALILEKIHKDDLKDNLDLMKNPAPKMPVSAKELEALGYSGLKLGVRIKFLESEWIKSGFKISKNELINL